MSHQVARVAQRKGQSNTVVTQLAADGQQLVYSTYLGGSSFDRGRDIVVRANGVAYAPGDSSRAVFPDPGWVGGRRAVP